MDQNIARYRLGIRFKKWWLWWWWWWLFTWILNITVHFTWYVYNRSNDPIQQLQFWRHLVTSYLTKYNIEYKGAGRSSPCFSRMVRYIRYDKMAYFLTYTPDNKWRRWAREGWSFNILTMCFNCNQGLCIECNIYFNDP